MLIEFRLNNYRSIREAQVLSMVAGAGTELPQNTCVSDSDASLQLVRSAVIYGPNAAGKSNLLRALYFMRKLVLSSAKESQQGETIDVESFLFNKKNREQPSEFEITFSKVGVRYQYGFTVNKNRISEEWLRAYPLGKMQQWFFRQYDQTSDQYEWKFSKFFIGNKKLWQSSTRSNALFLSTAIQLNNEQLLPIFNWFQTGLVVITSFRGIDIGKSIKQTEAEEGKRKILKYMNIADPSIFDISLLTEKFSEDKLPKNMPEDIRNIMKKDLDGKNLTEINFVHPDAVLNFHDESHGSQKFFAFSGYWIDALENGQVIVVDELDNSLHPLVVRFLINLVSNPETNPKNAQLIFSTHDTSLLDTELFRRDQIWFVEKDKEHSTQVYSLLDFSPRKDEAIGKGYLQGRYGAIPYIGDWRF